MQTLADRLAQPDMQGLADWQAANKLNAPDPSLSAVVEWAPTQIGPGTILEKFGPVAGATFLEQITAAAASNPVLKWGLNILNDRSFDLSLQVSRDQVDGLVQAGLMTADQRSSLLAISRRERRLSWAEANNMVGKIDARSVGIARGGQP